MPRNERGTRWIVGARNAWRTSASFDPLPPAAVESALSTLRSKSTTTGQRPTIGKLLLAACTQVISVHRNPRLSSTSDERHRGQVSKRAMLPNDAKPIASPSRSDALGGCVPCEISARIWSHALERCGTGRFVA